MAEDDLKRFLHKIDQLNALARSLETDDERRRLLAACSDHNAVVRLAAEWGYSIGRRWGEQPASATDANNLLTSTTVLAGEEVEQLLCSGPGWRLVRIHSNGASSPEAFWYEQDEHEWLTILKGSARLRLADPDVWVDLSVGDQLTLSSGRRHRVERTDLDPGTIWLALYWTDGSDAPPVASLV